MALSYKTTDDVDMTASKDTCSHTCTPCELFDYVSLQAEGYCLNCKEYLCENCYQCHCIPSATKKHVLMKGSKMPDLQIVKTVEKCEEVCPDHTYLLEYFCSTCCVVGCRECMESGHVQCGVSTVQEYLEKEKPGWNTRNRMRDYLQVTDCPMGKIQKIKDKIERYKFGVEVKANENRIQVKEFRKKVVEAFDELENDIDNKINNYCYEELSRLDMLEKKCDTIQDKFNNMKNKIAIDRSRENKCNLFVNRKIEQKETEMFKESKEFENLQKDLRLKSFMFKPTFREDVGERIVLGDLVEIPSKPQTNVWTNVGCINAKTKEEIEKSKESNYGCQSCKVSACVCLNDGKLMICDTINNTVRLCNSVNEGFDKEISDVICIVEVDAEPEDIAVVSDERVAVTLPSEKKIQFIEFDKDDKIKKGVTLDRNGECCGISCLDETLIVSYRSPGKVEFLDFDGNVLKTVSNEKFPNFSFVKPSSVTCDETRKLIYVSDFGGSCVVAVNSEGKIKAIFKQEGMREPLSVAVGKDGSVLVAVNRPYSIQRISPYFLEIETLQEKKDTWEIMSVAYSKLQNRIFFGNDSFYVEIRETD